MKHTVRHWLLAVATACLLCYPAGCSREKLPVEFEKNYVYAYRLQKESGTVMNQTLQRTKRAITDYFGSPNEPKLPEAIQTNDDLKTLVSFDRLQKAAGPANDETGTGLYQKHCAICHGISGEGRGPGAALLDPYPRDYRMGIFKFKTTPRGVKPTREDLTRVIRHGVPGTTMKAFDKLTDDEIQSLVDYVIYLSMRGETERLLLSDGATEVDWETDALYTPSNKEQFEEQKEILDEYVVDIAEGWLEASEEVVKIEIPASVPMLTEENASSSEVLASIDRGKALFLGSVAACSKCHGNDGRGDGQTTDYDEWAKDWTVRANIDPKNEAALVPMIARGALPPRTIRPRNFHEGLFRGGDKPEDLYRRIKEGIDGTPMPAATMKSGPEGVGLTPEDIADLVNFVRSLADKPSDSTKT